MSAHCHIHGCDLVYPEGSWPLGECRECVLEGEVKRLREALGKIAEGEFVTRQVGEYGAGDGENVFVDGKPARAVYVERLSPRQIARAALSQAGEVA